MHNGGCGYLQILASCHKTTNGQEYQLAGGFLIVCDPEVLQTEEEVGRQHQGLGRLKVRQVPEGSGEQEKMEETGCETTCGAPTPLAVKG